MITTTRPQIKKVENNQQPERPDQEQWDSLHMYHGLNNEEIPEDVIHVIVDSSVTIIKYQAFYM